MSHNSVSASLQMDSGHSAISPAFRKDVAQGMLGRRTFPHYSHIEEFPKKQSMDLGMSRFPPRLSILKHLCDLETCDPCGTRTDVREFISWLFRVPVCKSLNDVRAIMYLKLPEKIFPILLPALHHNSLKNSFDGVCQEPLPSVVFFFKGRGLCNLLSSNLKENRSHQTQFSHPNMRITALFRPLFSLARYYTTRKFTIVM